MSSKPVRTIISLAMNLFVALAILATARLIVEFFGQLAAQSWGKVVIALSNPVIISFGIAPINTPYGGIFDVSVAFTVVVFLCVDWVLSIIESRA